MTKSGQNNSGGKMAYLQNQPVSLEDLQKNLNYFSKYTNRRLFAGKEVYKLHENVRSYLEQPFADRDAKQKAHGNFIWALKKYFPTSFQKEAIILLDVNVKQLDLSDKDKINYLNYMLSMKNYNRFSVPSFQFFSDFAIDNDYMALQGRNVFHKMREILAAKYKKTDEYQQSAKRFYRFFDNYSKKCPQVTHLLVEEYTETLFKMSSKFPFEHIPLLPLKNLMERTVNLQHNQVRMQDMFGDEPENGKPQIDKKAVLNVLKSYVDYSLSREKENKNDGILYNSVTSMMCYFVKNYDYKPPEVRALRNELGGTTTSFSHRKRLYDMGRIILGVYNQEQPRKMDPRSKTIDPLLAAQKGRFCE